MIFYFIIVSFFICLYILGRLVHLSLKWVLMHTGGEVEGVEVKKGKRERSEKRGNLYGKILWKKLVSGQMRAEVKSWKESVMEREELLGVLVVCRISALCLEGPSICLDAPAGLPLHQTGGRTVTTHRKPLSALTWKERGILEKSNHLEEKVSPRGACLSALREAAGDRERAKHGADTRSSVSERPSANCPSIYFRLWGGWEVISLSWQGCLSSQ